MFVLDARRSSVRIRRPRSMLRLKYEPHAAECFTNHHVRFYCHPLRRSATGDTCSTTEAPRGTGFVGLLPIPPYTCHDQQTFASNRHPFIIRVTALTSRTCFNCFFTSTSVTCSTCSHRRYGFLMISVLVFSVRMVFLIYTAGILALVFWTQSFLYGGVLLYGVR